ncbi:cell division protein FtsZ [Ereboglobus luteus]|uniref:Cell division protein FtsZ n=1 Tax=Ereboglobus luteus TaxID=1796921 RepID=A0A2U8DZF6_9BACT|nr:cell division protein FtsZ [Ereboglobus luteus]AWI07986.1 hypothetical protein CKA38_00765 [Ereboglobus luteus]
MDLHELPLTPTASPDAPPVTFKLIGIGGGGANALARLPLPALDGLATAIIDTDRKAIAQHTSPAEKHLIAPDLRGGLSTGGDPELGRETAEASREQLVPLATGADIIFLSVALGGGTGGGVAPLVAELATENNALVIAFATLPFSFEGSRRMRQAEESLVELRRACDAVITLPNDLLLQQTTDTESVTDALRRADEWMLRGVHSIYSILRRPSLINLDLASLRRAFVSRGGKTLYALGHGSGENIITQTLESLKMCPLLHIAETARKVDHLIVNIIAGSAITLPQINDLMSVISAQYGRDAHVLMGTSISDDQPDAIQVCVIGTTDVGTRNRPVRAAPPPADNANAETNIQHPAPKGKKPVVKTKGAANQDQEEFTFAGADQQRGTFENSDLNLFEDQDLDRPTYLRKGIKIQL